MNDPLLKHVFIISHRRSGTHLTMDSISNNFVEFQNGEFINLDRIDRSGHPESNTLEQFQEKLEGATRLLKTHCLPDLKEAGDEPETAAFIAQIFSRSKKIYVFRNCFDVMVSLYEYMKTFDEKSNQQNFKEFLRSTRTHDGKTHFEYWNDHLKNWLQFLADPSFLFISYEELFGDYKKVLNRFSQFLELPLTEVVKDARIKKPTIDQGKYSYDEVQYTQGARKGIVGDFTNYFDVEDFQLVESVVGPVHKKLGFNFQEPRS